MTRRVGNPAKQPTFRKNALGRLAAGIVCWTLACATAQAQFWPAAPGVSRPETPHPAVVRVVVPNRDGESLGSGTLVEVTARHGLVLTNWHVINEASGVVRVVFPDGFQSGAVVLAADRDWDLAALAIWKPQVAPVPIATQIPRPGDLLTIAGYGPGPYRSASGPCTQYLSPGPRFPDEIVELATAARNGDSGGPIFNTQGQLAGTLFGTAGGRTSGSHCGRIRMFLASVEPRFQHPNVGLVQNAAPRNDQAVTRHDFAAATSPETYLPPAVRAANGARPTAPLVDVPPAATDLAAATSAGYSSPPVIVNRSLPSAFEPLTPAPPPRLPTPVVDSSGWEDLVGHSRGEQIKTGLAAIGVFALVIQALRLINTHPAKQLEA